MTDRAGRQPRRLLRRRLPPDRVGVEEAAPADRGPAGLRRAGPPPGDARRAHRPAQPGAAARPARAGPGRGQPLGRRGRAAADRPGPLQGDQRHPRPRLRRRAALPGRPAAASGPARRRHRRPARRRRVRRPAADGGRRRRGPRPSPSGCARRCTGPSRSTAWSWTSRPASASSLSPGTAPTPRSCCARRHRDVRRQGAKAGAVVYEPEEHVTAPSRLTLLGDLRRALESADELSCTTSRSAPWTASGSRASRRWCAGSTRPRADPARRVHPGRRGHRPDPAADRAGARTSRWRSMRALAGRRPRRPGRGQPLGPLPARRRPARPGRAAARRARRAGRRCCGSRSPRAPSWATRPLHGGPAAPARPRRPGSRSTTSAPATPRWPTCAGCRSTS